MILTQFYNRAFVLSHGVKNEFDSDLVHNCLSEIRLMAAVNVLLTAVERPRNNDNGSKSWWEGKGPTKDPADLEPIRGVWFRAASPGLKKIQLDFGRSPWMKVQLNFFKARASLQPGRLRTFIDITGGGFCLQKKLQRVWRICSGS